MTKWQVRCMVAAISWSNIRALSTTVTRSVSAPLDLARLPSSGEALAAQASRIADTLAPGLRGADAVGAARLEAAALDFAREVRILHIGGIDRPAAELDAIVQNALASGDAAAAALPDVGFTSADRATTALSTAARIIADTSAPPLVPYSRTGDM